MTIYKLLAAFFFIQSAFSCAVKKDADMEQQIKTELTIIDSLLKSDDFSLSIAMTQDTAYYTGIGQAVPPFLAPAENSAVVIKSVKEEKIATNLAGFYALECGIGVLCDLHGEKPTALLEKIINDKTDTGAVLLLNRFANATWKAGQPFRALDRIKRKVFTVASFLPEDEVKKDYYQIKTAATKLMASMQKVKDSAVTAQMLHLRSLLQSRPYALEMAAYMDSAYYVNEKKPAPPFISANEDTARVQKSVKDQKTATNLAGFYALECGLSYLVTTRKLLPSIILQSIVSNTISREEKNLFARFANATWKAGQPFRDLKRIERETFTPFYFLSEADIDKDWVQVKAAAARILPML